LEKKLLKVSRRTYLQNLSSWVFFGAVTTAVALAVTVRAVRPDRIAALINTTTASALIIRPNKALQPTVLPSLRYGKTAAEFGRWALK
jgi:hypothetical protein